MVEISKPFAATWHRLRANGYSPMPLRPASQAAFLKDWPTLCRDPLSEAECERFAGSPSRYNVGLALGYRGPVICDRDTDDERIIAALRPVFLEIYARGGVPVAKFGSKGLTSFFRWAGETSFRNLSRSAAELGTIIELSGSGRSTVLPPSIHPKTGKPYTWRTRRTLLDTHVDELPVLTAADVRAIEEAIAPFLPPPKAPTIFRPKVLPFELEARERKQHERYALKIIEREVPVLAAMQPESGRNAKALRIASRVGKWMHAGIIEQRHVVEPIMRACETNGLVRDTSRLAVLKTINSGLSLAAGDTLPDLRAQLGGRR
jgi:hypothetical protein